MGFWIFFILFLFICFGPFNVGGISHSNIRKIVGCSFLIFITILRFDVGYDYSGYYQSIFPSIDFEEYDRVEPANKLIFEWVANQHFPPLLFIIYGLITLILFIYSFNNYTKNFFIAIFVYLALFFIGGLSTIRQEIAVSITLFGYRYVRDNKFWLYLLTCAIAVLFHDTAFVALLIYPFLRIKNIRISVLFTFLLILVLILFIQVLLNLPYFSAFYYYIDNMDSFQGGSINKILYLSLSIGTFFISLKKHDRILTNMSLLCLVGTTFMFALGGHVGGRIAEYFTIYFCILIPNILEYYKQYIVRVAGILTLWFIANVYTTTQIPQKTPITPYQTILTVDLSNPHFK